MEWLGWLTTAAFSVCYWPQLYRSWKRKSVGDVSVWAWIIQSIGYAMGISYGLWLNQGPLIFGYCHGLFCSLLFLAMYWRYRKNHV